MSPDLPDLRRARGGHRAEGLALVTLAKELIPKSKQ